jgi:hypothetical protein
MGRLEIYLLDILLMFSGFKHLQGILTLRSKADTPNPCTNNYVFVIGSLDFLISGFETGN